MALLYLSRFSSARYDQQSRVGTGGGEQSRDSRSSVPHLRFYSFNPCGNSVDENLLAADRVREDLTEDRAFALGHETNVGCQEAEKEAFLNST